MELLAPTEAGRDALRAMLPDLRRDLASTGAGSLFLAAGEDDPVEGVLRRVYAEVPREVWPAARMSIRAQLQYLGVR